jgi:hypothetical protein
VRQRTSSAHLRRPVARHDFNTLSQPIAADFPMRAGKL